MYPIPGFKREMQEALLAQISITVLEDPQKLFEVEFRL